MTATDERRDRVDAAPPDTLADGVRRYLDSPLFDASRGWFPSDPYHRPVGDVSEHDFTRRPARPDALGASALAAHRMLINIYEADLVFLPDGRLSESWDAFHEFYSGRNRARGEAIRPALEDHAFGFLDDAVEVTGRWDVDELEGYLRALLDRDLGEPTVAQRAIEDSTDPARAARMWLVQLAPDYLSEASPMVRKVLGNYGGAQSEWFKIIIDEYGYGVHDAKHSTLYEDTLRTAGLESTVHHYWPYYLPGSLLMTNYFHLLGKNHENLFRYLGALYLTETSLVEFCRNAEGLVRDVLGEAVDATYFSEHVHIDTHHGRMTLENLLLPLVARCGEAVIPSVVRGFEEYQVVADVADADFAAQVRFMDGVDPDPAVGDGPSEHLRLDDGTALGTRSHDAHRRYRVTSGRLRVRTGLDAERVLETGQELVVPRHRLHGVVPDAGGCTVEVTTAPPCSS